MKLRKKNLRLACAAARLHVPETKGDSCINKHRMTKQGQMRSLTLSGKVSDLGTDTQKLSLTTCESRSNYQMKSMAAEFKQ